MLQVPKGANIGESGNRNFKVHSPNYVPKKRVRPEFEEMAAMAEV